MIDELTKNINSEIEILREISAYNKRMEYADELERRLLLNAIDSLKESMKLINGTIPHLLSEVSIAKKLPVQENKTPKLETIAVKRTNNEIKVTLQAKDKARFLKELSISEEFIKKLKKKDRNYKDKLEEYKAARGYLKLSNKFFLETSNNLIKKGKFKPLSIEIKKANLDILFETYISMILFTTFISFILSIFLVIFLLFFKISLGTTAITMVTEGYLLRFMKLFWLVVFIPIGTFFLLYTYPSTEKKSISKRIDQELPFAVIHMSAISGSGIQPSEIFRIIGTSREYPFLKKEIRKVLNQINLYGYDLVTALNNVSKATPSVKLAELFGGLSTTISSGGELSVFFEKRAETLLLAYRLEREKYIKLAEAFMDIYISVVIAAPMILMLLFVMISVSGIGIPFSQTEITLLIIFLISIINVLFLAFLHVKQPVY